MALPAPAAAAAVIIQRDINISSLPTFGSTTNDDIIDFFDEFDINVEFYELSDQLKAKLLPQVLKDRALTFYRTLDQNARNDYDNIKSKH